LFIALWLVRIPFAWLLIPRSQADAIWWSFPVGSGVAALLMWLYYRYGRWQGAHMLPDPLVVASTPAER
jgi:Na+-driven multidrug efflux pump